MIVLDTSYHLQVLIESMQQTRPPYAHLDRWADICFKSVSKSENCVPKKCMLAGFDTLFSFYQQTEKFLDCFLAIATSPSSAHLYFRFDHLPSATYSNRVYLKGIEISKDKCK